MKKNVFFILLACSSLCVSAQEMPKSKLTVQNSSVDVMVGTNASILFYNWKEGSVISHQETTNGDLNGPPINFAIAFKSRLYKSLFLRTEFGTNSTSSLIEDLKYTYPGNQSATYIYARYENERAYISLLPEWRPAALHKVIYVNAGVTLMRTLVNKYTAGEVDYPSAGYVVLATFPQSANTTTIGYSANIGVNPTFKYIGFVFNLGYNYVPPVEIVTGTPEIGFYQFTVKTGITYLIR